MHKFKITNTEGGAALPVSLTLNAKSNRVTGKSEESMHIDLTAGADSNQIDQYLTEFMSQKLDIGTDKIAIASGKAVDKKVVIILSLPPEEIEKRLLDE